jgi:hypothetical protein
VFGDTDDSHMIKLFFEVYITILLKVPLFRKANDKILSDNCQDVPKMSAANHIAVRKIWTSVSS